MGLMANIVCMSIIKVVGKRKLYFVSLVGTSLSCFALGFYGYNVLPAGVSSFENNVNATTAAVPIEENYIAMCMFFSMAFFTSVGITPIPWIILSEVFPFK